MKAAEGWVVREMIGYKFTPAIREAEQLDFPAGISTVLKGGGNRVASGY